jgi:mobilome CxxCx(11)CxxC protein
MDYTKECWGKEFHSYGTAQIFERRSKRLQKLRTWITFLGIISPVLIGGTVLAFGTNAKILPLALTCAGVVGLIQLTLSVWSLVARWDEQYEYALESIKANTELYNRFRRIPSSSTAKIPSLYSEACNDYQARELIDITKGISEPEKCFANRKSLHYYQKPCSVCKIVPTSLKPSKCDSCGKF